MALIDCFLYNGERDILKLHLSILSPFVDKFIIVEANQTFTGHPKILHFFNHQRYFKPWWGKIDYYIINNWEDKTLWELAREESTYHDQLKFYIRESILKSLKASHVQDKDTVFIGDVGEIIDPKSEYESDTPVKARLRVYRDYLNNESNERYYGTLIAEFKDIKDNCLNDMRKDSKLHSKGDTYLGWKFTKNLDIPKKHPTFTHNESNWPEYLKTYKGMFKYAL